MKKTFFLSLGLVIIAMTSYAQNWTPGTGLLYTNPSTTKVGIGITPSELFHVNGGALKIGNGADVTSRSVNMIKIGDGSYIQIGEWEQDDVLSFKANQYNFTNGNVGIGILSPIAKLDVRGDIYTPTPNSFRIGSLNDSGYRLRLHNNGTNAYIDYYKDLYFRSGISNSSTKFVFTSDGYVGIGTDVPTEKLDVKGSINATETLLASRTAIRNTANSDWGYVSWTDVNRDLSKAFVLTNSSTGTRKEVFVVFGNGVVNAKKIYAEEIQVTSNTMGISWYDHVFAPDYKLRPLKEVESFIQKNKHLPEIPSEKEVQENGINLGEIQGKLLLKIEELTLYIIDLQKQIDELKQTKE